MDDLIRRQDAIDAIQDEISKESHRPHQITLLHAKRRIKNLPSAQQWIPVSERLPEDLQPVLVWYEYWHWKAEELIPEYGIGWRLGELWCGDPSSGSRLRVIAWCELPEPYEEEQGE